MSSFKIDGQEIAAGTFEHLKLNVAGLPSGTKIHINVHVFRAKKPGPSILIMGGLHGDEINGVETVSRIISSGQLKKLSKGTVIAIPLLNVFGFNNFSRSVRDGKDVNRSFPGSKNGSLASRVANMMSTQILPNIDFGVDFHTGGASIFNHPQIRVSKGDEKALELAQIFSAPITLINKPIAKSHRLQAYNMGKPILVFEGGESLRLDEDSIQCGVEGIERILQQFEMLNSNHKKKRTQLFKKGKWLRASVAGVVFLTKKAGEVVKKGEVVGYIHNLETLKKTTIKSPEDATILAHVNNPVVSRGDALYHLVF